MTKGSSDANTAAAVILRLREATVQMDANGLLVPQRQVPILTRDPSPEDEGALRYWAHREFLSITAAITRRPFKAGTLTEGQIYLLYRARYRGDGMYLDASGVELPLCMASIDRLDLRKGYSLNNVRVLHRGLNFLRNVTLDDAPLAASLAYIKRADLAHLVDLAASTRLSGLGREWLAAIANASDEDGDETEEEGENGEGEDESCDDESSAICKSSSTDRPPHRRVR